MLKLQETMMRQPSLRLMFPHPVDETLQEPLGAVNPCGHLLSVLETNMLESSSDMRPAEGHKLFR